MHGERAAKKGTLPPVQAFLLMSHNVNYVNFHDMRSLSFQIDMNFRFFVKQPVTFRCYPAGSIVCIALDMRLDLRLP